MAGTPRHPWPTRVLHWSFAPAVLAGIWSGLYLHKPSRRLGFRSMNQARLTHAIARCVLLPAFVARVYYGWATGDWREIIPSRRTVAAAPGFAKYELFLRRKKPRFPKYNPGEKALFTSFLVLVALQLLTGIGLWLPKSRIAGLTGGFNRLRRLHYLIFLAISSLSAGHIYLALSESLRKLKSIFTGCE